MMCLKLIDGPLAESFAVICFLLYRCYSTFNDKADVQEQFISSFVTVSGRQAVIGVFLSQMLFPVVL
jgi:hypothetical protein